LHKNSNFFFGATLRRTCPSLAARDALIHAATTPFAQTRRRIAGGAWGVLAYKGIALHGWLEALPSGLAYRAKTNTITRAHNWREKQMLLRDILKNTNYGDFIFTESEIAALQKEIRGT